MDGRGVWGKTEVGAAAGVVKDWEFPSSELGVTGDTGSLPPETHTLPCALPLPTAGLPEP